MAVSLSLSLLVVIAVCCGVSQALQVRVAYGVNDALSLCMWGSCFHIISSLVLCYTYTVMTVPLSDSRWGSVYHLLQCLEGVARLAVSVYSRHLNWVKMYVC